MNNNVGFDFHNAINPVFHKPAAHTHTHKDTNPGLNLVWRLGVIAFFLISSQYLTVTGWAKCLITIQALVAMHRISSFQINFIQLQNYMHSKYGLILCTCKKRLVSNQNRTQFVLCLSYVNVFFFSLVMEHRVQNGKCWGRGNAVPYFVTLKVATPIT